MPPNIKSFVIFESLSIYYIQYEQYRTMLTCTAFSSTSTANTWSPPATCMYITNSNSPWALFWMSVMITSLGWIGETWLEVVRQEEKNWENVGRMEWGREARRTEKENSEGEGCGKMFVTGTHKLYACINTMLQLPYCLTTWFIILSTVSVDNHCGCVSECILHCFSKLQWKEWDM